MSLFEQQKRRKIQAKANAFVKSMEGKDIKDIERMYLDNKEMLNNEIVLSYLFFNYPDLIVILPKDFQKNRINSNLNMFKYASNEVKNEIVSEWLKNNKFFTNALAVNFSEEEYEEYILMYFNQPEDVANLYMEDLRNAIKVLAKNDIKETIKIIDKIKDKLTDKQWNFIIEVDPIFIQYAPQSVQNKYTDEKYVEYINGDARKNYITKQLDKLKEDFSLFETSSIDVQCEYINNYPFMINEIDEDVLIELIKYDVSLIKYLNISCFKDKKDKTQRFVYEILSNIKNKSKEGLIDILINKGLFNAKGKLYRFDDKSNNLSYQYNKRIIKIMQSLPIESIISLISIDVNYVLPYIVPIYSEEADKAEKNQIILECNSRCLNLFRIYYNNEDLFNKYYKVINKIYNEYQHNIDEYNFFKDYYTIFDLFKVLFNKKIMLSNPTKNIITLISTHLNYKNYKGNEIKKYESDLLNAIVYNAYQINTDNKLTLNELTSLEIFDQRLNFISKNVLREFNKYNFSNISTLLYIVKGQDKDLFIDYYNILINIYREDNEILFKAVENFAYNKELLKSIQGKELSDIETENLIDILSTFNNRLNITNVSELSNYEVKVYKSLINQVSVIKDEKIRKNLLSNFLFNRGYNEKGDFGWLNSFTIEQLLDVFTENDLKEFEVENTKVFTEDEIMLFNFIKEFFTSESSEDILKFIENLMESKTKRNIVSTSTLFIKIKKYRRQLINELIITLDELDFMSEEDPNMIEKIEREGITIYKVKNVDFKILSSYNDDKIHYSFTNISKLEKNCYGYENMPIDAPIKFSTYEENTIIKFSKDKIMETPLEPKYIVAFGVLNDDIINVAKNKRLNIVLVGE